jgi:hypothetical protein
MRSDDRGGWLRALFLAAFALLPAGGASGQTISNISIVKNLGNSADALQTGNDAYQQKTAVSIESSSATTFATRYAEIVGADTDAAATRSVTQNSDYTISFDVTAPGGYALTVETLLNGAFTLVDDGNTAAADMSGVAGSAWRCRSSGRRSGSRSSEGTALIPSR